MKKLIMSTVAAAILATGLSASSIEGLTKTDITCVGGSEGYHLQIEREATDVIVEYSSCPEGGKIIVRGGDGSSESLAPTVAANGTCEGGFNNEQAFEEGTVVCVKKGLSVLSEGFLELTTASYLYLAGNQLTNVDGLSNLTTVDYLDLSSNQLTNISGLNNLSSVESGVFFDDRNYGVKLDADSYLCENFDTKVNGVSDKSYICND